MIKKFSKKIIVICGIVALLTALFACIQYAYGNDFQEQSYGTSEELDNNLSDDLSSAYWGLSGDSSKTLYLSSTKTENATIRQDDILKGYNDPEAQPWAYTKISITSVIIEQSCNGCKLHFESAKSLFCGLQHCTQISGFENADFSCCKDMSKMFCDCYQLRTINLSSFDTSSVESMHEMFSECYVLPTLDLSSFSNKNLKDIGSMFYDCAILKTIIADNFKWEDAHRYNDSSNVFFCCNDIVGHNDKRTHETSWDVNFIDDTRARVDLDENNQGYFTSKEYHTAFWGLSEGDDKTLYISAGKTDNAIYEDTNILYGYELDSPRPWSANMDLITSVVIEQNNTNDKLRFISAECIFRGLQNCKKFTGFENADFSKCWTMHRMFYSCEKVTDLDLSSFNTSSLLDMNFMFCSCGSLKNLNLSSFNTSHVTWMECMFSDCCSLTNLDMSSCYTPAVESMICMFENCRSLTTLNLPLFCNKHLNSISMMFSNCTNLNTIKVDKALWDSNHEYDDISNYTFWKCYKLLGHSATGQHFTYWSENYDGCKKACVDVDDMHPGYFSDVNYVLPTAFWGLSEGDNKTLYLSGAKSEHATVRDDNILNGYSKDHCQPWADKKSSIKSVIIEPNDENRKLKFASTSFLFDSLDNCKCISGFENTDFVECVNMSYMFNGCKLIGSLDLKSINTNNVNDMRYMFNDCANLNTIDLSTFTNSHLNNIEHMFSSCSSLTTIKADKSIWVKDHQYGSSDKAFAGCFNLVAYNAIGQHVIRWDKDVTDGSRAYVDINNKQSGYFTDNDYFQNGFWGMSKDNTILYLSAAKTKNAINANAGILKGYDNVVSQPWANQRHNIKSVVIEPNSLNYKMHFSSAKALFYFLDACTQMTGFENADFSECVDMSRMFEFCKSLKLLNLQSIDTKNVSNMSGMFAECISLDTIHIENFNTVSVKHMNNMFNNCYSLTNLDLSSFSNAKVNDIDLMFFNCSSLKLIKADSTLWDKNHVYSSSTFTFYNCIHLVGYSKTGHCTKWNGNIIDGLRACVDIDEKNPGYFTDKACF